jgi:hypothetical protein
MDAAEMFLGIPQILDARDLASEFVDEKITISYLSYFKEKVNLRLSTTFDIPVSCGARGGHNFPSYCRVYGKQQPR